MWHPTAGTVPTQPEVHLNVVASAEDALRLARTEAVDLWVVSTNLPGLSGFELCSMLRQRFPQAAIFLVADAYCPLQEQAAWQHRATLFACKGGHLDLLDEWLAGCSR
jgi:DNA-binding NarL/FixJ family response regulator